MEKMLFTGIFFEKKDKIGRIVRKIRLVGLLERQENVGSLDRRERMVGSLEKKRLVGSFERKERSVGSLERKERSVGCRVCVGCRLQGVEKWYVRKGLKYVITKVIKKSGD